MKFFRKTLCLVVFAALLASSSAAQQYNIKDTIGWSNEKDNAVLWLDSTALDISENSFVLVSKKVVTIWNEAGSSFSALGETYNSYCDLNKMRASLYDKDGKLIKTVKDKDFVKVSASGLTSAFYQDEWFKVYKFTEKNYPYTIVFEYEKKYNTLFFLPNWVRQPISILPVKKAVLTLKADATAGVKTKSIHFEDSKHLVSEKSRSKQLEKQWQFEKLPKKVHFPAAPSPITYEPQILISASKIKFHNYEGNTDTWENLGYFFGAINKDKDQLNQAQQNTIKGLVASISSPKEKIAKLYAYLQSNTRYVLNSKGILGWQSIPAEEVLRVGYGDCKGLSNLMKGMLQAAGIPSHLVLVNANEENQIDLDKTFPQNVFNHVILCVPLEKDTVWLECTSSDFPAGYLGDFTQGREALILTDKGGKISRTPAYNRDEDFVERKMEIKLDFSKSKQLVLGKSVYGGPLHDKIRSHIIHNTAGMQCDYVKSALPFNSFEIQNCKYKLDSVPNKIPRIEEELVLDVKGLVSETSKRYIFSLPIFRMYVVDIETDDKEKRTLPIVFKDEYQYNYQYKIDFPEQVTLESLLQQLLLDKPYGKFSFIPTQKGNSITIDIGFVMKTGTFPASIYDDYVSFFQAISKACQTVNLTFVKK